MRWKGFFVIFLVLFLVIYLAGRGKKKNTCSLEATQSPKELLFCGAE